MNEEFKEQVDVSVILPAYKQRRYTWHACNSEVCDHQCGFKAFHRKPLLRILDDVDAVHWFWDTELLIRASQRGFRIKEIRVKWKGLGKTKVNLFKDSLSMGFQVLQLSWKLRNQAFTEENPLLKH